MDIHIDDLFSLDDTEFIRAAYERILGRAADPAGLRHYRTLLRSGASKVRVVSDLARSGEALRQNVSVPGLERRIAKERRARLPFVGSVLRAMSGSVLDTPTLRFQNRLLDLLERQAETLDRALERLDTSARTYVAGQAPSPAAHAESVGVLQPNVPFDNHLEPHGYERLRQRPDPISQRYLASLLDANRRLTTTPMRRLAPHEDIKISILMPVYKVPLCYLNSAIESVRNQCYFNWDLCIVDDGSNDAELRSFLLAAEASDPRIRVHISTINGGISAATNLALDLAEGAFVGLLDNDDVLTLDALDRVAYAISLDKNADILYSDEFKVDTHGHATELFPKPDWSPSALLNCMYIGHFTVYRRGLLFDAGRFRSEFDFSQDYDLALRATEQATRIIHIPVALYGWRMIPGSSAQGDKPQARSSNLAALASAMQRRGLAADVLALPMANHARIDSSLPFEKASIVVPSDNGDNIVATLDSIRTKSSFTAYEIVVVTNSRIVDQLQSHYASDNRVKFVRYNKPFNFSDKCNVGAGVATGDLLVFFNDDVRVRSGDWLERILEVFCHGNVGVVGPKLLYEDGTIQHAGMVTGCRGLVGTAFHCLPADTGQHFGAAQWMREVSLICGALLAIPTRVFEAINGFDPINAPISHSDVDLCFRVRELGYRCVYTPHATLVHIGHLSIGAEEAEKAKMPLGTVRARDKADIFLLRRWSTHCSYDPYFPQPMRDIAYHDSPDSWQLYSSHTTFPSTGGLDVLLISHDLSSSGAPRVIYEIARGLREVGHFVTVISPVDGPFRQLLNEANIPVIIDSLIFKSHESVVRLARNFDLAICNTVVSWPAVRTLSPHLPVYWYIHEMSLLTHLLNIEPQFRSAFDECKNIWAGSEHAAQLIRSIHPLVSVIEYGVPSLASSDKMGPTRTSKNEPLRFSIFGSFEPRKGQDLAALAIQQLATEHKKRIHVRMYGRTLDPTFYSGLKKIIGAQTEIQLMGELSSAEYLKAVGETDFVLVSSRDDTLPLVSIDALSAGRILVVTQNTGTSSYLTNGRNGFVADSAAPHHIAAAITEAIDSWDRREDIVRDARLVFETNFSQYAFMRKLSKACDLTLTPSI